MVIIFGLSGLVKVSVENTNNMSEKLSVVLVFFMLPAALRSFSKKKNSKKIIFAVIVVILYGAWNYIHYESTFISLLMKLIWFLLFYMACLYFQEINLDILNTVYNVTFFISCISLILYFFVVVIKIQLPYTVIYSSSDNIYRNYFNLFTLSSFYEIDFLGFSIYRLHSIFWEPGVYQIFLNLALYYWVFKKKKKNIGSLIVLLLNIILTFSTTGYCVAAVMLGWWMYDRKINRRWKFILVIPIVILVALFVRNTLNQKIITGFNSYKARVSDLYIGWQLFLRNFWFGMGYDNTDIFASIQGWGRGNSNGLITWLYTMRIVGAFVVFAPFITNILTEKDKREKISRAFFWGVFVLMNMSEPIYFAPIMWLLVAREYSLLNYNHRRNGYEKKKEVAVHCT